jgi:EF hand domain-containing protein
MIFGRADRNHDGKLTKDEFPEFLWSRLSKSDADKDGTVSKSEMEEHIKKRHSGKKSDSGDNRPADGKPKSPSA